jgi:hypothetical protein
MNPSQSFSGRSRIQVVKSFEELLATPLVGRCNAVCWQRTLAGDFEEVVSVIQAGKGPADGVDTIDEDRLSAMCVSDSGAAAVATLLSDLQQLREVGHRPILDCVVGYARDDEDEAVATDVYSFHVDRATVAAETFLCSYTSPASEGLCNEDAVRRVDIPEIRARLLQQFGGRDGEEFRAWLAEHCFDLHYAPLADARPFDFGVGNLWRIAVDYPGRPVPACIHRAPHTPEGVPPRLLLIS